MAAIPCLAAGSGTIAVAINNNASNQCKIIGCRIEGTNGQALGAASIRTYGILDGFGGADPSKISNSLIAGLVVTGQWPMWRGYM